MKTHDFEQIASVTTAINVTEPGSSSVSAHFSTRKGFDICRIGGIVRILRGKDATCVPMANVVCYTPSSADEK